MINWGLFLCYSESWCEEEWLYLAVCAIFYGSCASIMVAIIWIHLLWFLFGMYVGKGPSSGFDSEAFLYVKLSGIRSLKIKSSESIGSRSCKFKWHFSNFECAGTYIWGVVRILCELFHPHSCITFSDDWYIFFTTILKSSPIALFFLASVSTDTTLNLSKNYGLYSLLRLWE